MHSPHLDLAATEESGDAAVSLSTVMDKLIRQAERHVGKLRVRKGGGRRPTSVRTTPPAVSAPREERGPRVIRNRRFAVKPMTIEEAALEVGASADGVLGLPRRLHRARERALQAQGREPRPHRAGGLRTPPRTPRRRPPLRLERRQESREGARVQVREMLEPSTGLGLPAGGGGGRPRPGRHPLRASSGRASPSPGTPNTSATAACRSWGPASSATCASSRPRAAGRRPASASPPAASPVSW